MVATESGNRKGKTFFVVREKSGKSQGILLPSQGKFKSWKDVREKGNFESTYLFFSPNFYCFVTPKILLYILWT